MINNVKGGIHQNILWQWNWQSRRPNNLLIPPFPQLCQNCIFNWLAYVCKTFQDLKLDLLYNCIELSVSGSVWLFLRWPHSTVELRSEGEQRKSPRSVPDCPWVPPVAPVINMCLHSDGAQPQISPDIKGSEIYCKMRSLLLKQKTVCHPLRTQK